MRAEDMHTRRMKGEGSVDEGRPSNLEDLGERRRQREIPKAHEWDRSFMERLLPLMDIFNSYFDSEVRGLERLPASGPMLLIGNHSGGTIVPDTTATLAAWYHERGLDEPLLGLALDSMFDLPGIAQLMTKIGQIPANHENAEAVLSAGASLLVYPGGAREAFRPWHDRNRIDFSGHRGFVKLALRTGVPVVPVVGHGGQHSVVVLSRGEGLAKMLGMDRFRLDIAPVLWQVPWGVSIPLQMGLPLPAKIDVEVLEPIDWSMHGPEAAEDPEIVDACYTEITGRMQETLDRLARNRPYPVAERLLGLMPSSLSRIFRPELSSREESAVAERMRESRPWQGDHDEERRSEDSC